MSSKIIKVALALILFATQNSHALTADKIPCPAASTIKQLGFKIDTASEFGDSYVASTSQPALYESKKYWAIIAFVNGASQELAVLQGKKAVESVSFAEQEYAIDPGNGQLSCAYGPRKIGEVYALVVYK
jgi:hypothetical protein